MYCRRCCNRSFSDAAFSSVVLSIPRFNSEDNQSQIQTAIRFLSIIKSILRLFADCITIAALYMVLFKSDYFITLVSHGYFVMNPCHIHSLQVPKVKTILIICLVNPILTFENKLFKYCFFLLTSLGHWQMNNNLKSIVETKNAFLFLKNHSASSWPLSLFHLK